MSSFVDYTKITCSAGDGGHGCVSFRREKFVPRGGPNGGDGGDGGSVWLEVDHRIVTLLDCKLRPHQNAKNGGHGRGKDQHGRNGEDRIVRIPQGTVVTVFEQDEEENEKEIEVVDLAERGQRHCVARGGSGGRGNARFATASRQAPHEAQDGRPGQVRRVVLELKLIADAGLIGLPNAGKSTLLAHLTRATPKIASYPFTTLHPNLGVMEGEFGEQITLADIPGLIEGAHRGQGLGDRFLRHIERTRILVHLVALDSENLNFDDLWATYQIVHQELEAYSARLTEKPEIVVLNKIDLLKDADQQSELKRIVKAFRKKGVKPLTLSGLEALQLESLEAAIRSRIESLDAVQT